MIFQNRDLDFIGSGVDVPLLSKGTYIDSSLRTTYWLSDPRTPSTGRPGRTERTLVCPVQTLALEPHGGEFLAFLRETAAPPAARPGSPELPLSDCA